MRSSLIKTLILSGILRCLTASNNLWNELCSSKEVVSAEIITCSLIIRDFTAQQRQRLIHRDPRRTYTSFCHESTGSLIWAQIRPKQAENVCVFSWMRPIGWWMDIDGWGSVLSTPGRIQDACVSCWKDQPSFSEILHHAPPPIQKSTRRSIYRLGGQTGPVKRRKSWKYS